MSMPIWHAKLQVCLFQIIHKVRIVCSEQKSRPQNIKNENYRNYEL